MPRNRLIVTLAIVVLGAVSLAAAAQETPEKPELVVVYKDHVKPSMVEEYSAAARDMVALLREEKADSPAFRFWAFSGPDLTYSYVTPMDGFAAMDTMHKEWMDLYKGPDKTKWEALDARLNPAIAWSERLVAAKVPGASYAPKDPRLTMDEARYRWYDICVVMPGKEKEFVTACKALADLSAKAGFPDRWTVYAVVVGGPMPCFVVITPAKDPADYMASEAAWTKAVGEEGKKQMHAIMAVTQHYDGHGEWYHPDLSYEGPSAKKAAEEKGAKK
jgi:hypothetical protein